ncbi:type II secretion system protein F [Nocardioides sp. Soil797]|nr:type II secretion system protein F [Nocardioides sp. Soil797]
MGALIGLGFGLGLALIWSAFVLPRSTKEKNRSPDRLTALLASAGMQNVSSRNLIGLCVALGVIALAVMQILSGTLPVAVVFGAIAAYIPLTVVKGRAAKRQREFAEVWPEAVDHLASGVRAGMSLPEALVGLSSRGPEPLRPAFEKFALDYQVTGRFGDSLDLLKDSLADPVGDRVVEALRIAREVGGGDLGRLLRNLSSYLRDDLHTRSELESRQAWTVNGARLAVAAPWIVLLLMCFQPEIIQRYRSPAGALVLAGGALLCVVAYRLMMRIGRLPVDRRILA